MILNLWGHTQQSIFRFSRYYVTSLASLCLWSTFILFVYVLAVPLGLGHDRVVQEIWGEIEGDLNHHILLNPSHTQIDRYIYIVI
jgi:hypothetical protein